MPKDNQIDDILHAMWAGGLDWASSDDFKELREGDDVEKADYAYLRFQNNLTNRCKAALAIAIREAMPRKYAEISPNTPHNGPIIGEMEHNINAHAKGYNEAIDQVVEALRGIGLDL